MASKTRRNDKGAMGTHKPMGLIRGVTSPRLPARRGLGDEQRNPHAILCHIGQLVPVNLKVQTRRLLLQLARRLRDSREKVARS